MRHHQSAGSGHPAPVCRLHTRYPLYCALLYTAVVAVVAVAPTRHSPAQASPGPACTSCSSLGNSRARHRDKFSTIARVERVPGTAYQPSCTRCRVNCQTKSVYSANCASIPLNPLKSQMESVLLLPSLRLLQQQQNASLCGMRV